MTYKIWNCPSFSAILGFFWKLAWDPVPLTHLL